jgi:ABC-2 type transport system ATP-binding protein
MLHASRVRLVGGVDELVAEHKQLVGPRHGNDPVAGVAAVLRASHTDRQSTLLVRTNATIDDPRWTVHEVTLEDLVLAYLAEGGTQSSHEAWGVPA